MTDYEKERNEAALNCGIITNAEYWGFIQHGFKAGSDWGRAWESDRKKRIDILNAQIQGLIDATRPLLDEWTKLRGTPNTQD